MGSYAPGIGSYPCLTFCKSDLHIKLCSCTLLDKTDPEIAKKVIFWPFLAFDGRLRGHKDSLEVRVEHETCTTVP